MNSIAFPAPVASVDADLRRRAAAVIPGGMYGHQSAKHLWPGAPQFIASAEGAVVRDVDGREYIDLLCSYGPIVLGHRHPEVEAAAQEQAMLGDCFNLPGPRMVELAERLTGIVDYADWAMFQKNGTDATTLALTVARAHTGRKGVLMATGAYHGAAPWCTPIPLGTTPGARADLYNYRYNDIASVEAALAACGDDLAAVIVSPFRHDAGLPQELVEPEFARYLRALCDEKGAMLVLDEVRCGMRLGFGSSWAGIGVAPDLSAWSKALGNGHPIAALMGIDVLRPAIEKIFTTGSFWFSSVAMAASLATLAVMERDGSVARMHALGQVLWDGLLAQAAKYGVPCSLTGHVTMPYLCFPGESEWAKTDVFAAACAKAGVFTHPRHNWFISAALSDAQMARILEATGEGFAAVAAISG